MAIQNGDKVKITHKVASHFNGWRDSWVADMDKYVGKEGIVQLVDGVEQGIRVRFENPSGVWYFPLDVVVPVVEAAAPVFVPKSQIQILETRPTELQRSTTVFNIRDKVKVVRKIASYSFGWRASWVSLMDDYIGKEGVVSNVYGVNDVVVQFGALTSFSFPKESLELVPVAPKVLYAPLAVVKSVALELGKSNVRVTASQVQTALETRGLGKASGGAIAAAFQNPLFKNTGEYVQSAVKAARGRKVAVWEYSEPVISTVGQPLTDQLAVVGRKVAIGKGYKPVSEAYPIGLVGEIIENNTLKNYIWPIKVRFTPSQTGVFTVGELVLA